MRLSNILNNSIVQSFPEFFSINNINDNQAFGKLNK